MINPEDERWLKKIIADCLVNIEKKAADEKRLDGFSMLVGNMVANIEKNLDETRRLWEKDPDSDEIMERFRLLERCLFYLKRFCEEKITDNYKKKEG